MEKMTRLARILNIILGILFWFMVVTLVFLTGAIAVLAIQKGLDWILTDPSSPIQITGIEALGLNPKIAFCVMMGAVLIVVILELISLAMFRRVLRETRDGDPFSNDSCKALKTAARISLFSFLVYLAEVIWKFVSVLRSGALTASVNSVSADLTIDLTLLITTMVLYLLYHIFEYGGQRTSY